MNRKLLVGGLTALLLACGTGSEGEENAAGTSDALRTTRESREALRLSELRRRTSYLASDDLAGRDEGSAGGLAARAFIVRELEACGVYPGASGFAFEQPITTGVGANVLGVVPGTDRRLADRYIVVSAHYDHIGIIDGKIYNGAQDNAASVASVLAVACATAKSPLPRSVLFALWDAEEPPTFLEKSMGSEFYARHPTVPLSNIDAALVLRPDRRKFVGQGARAQRAWRRALSRGARRSRCGARS